MNGIRLPFVLSLIGHGIVLACIALFVAGAPPLPLSEPSGIRVGYVPTLPPAPVPPAPPVVPAPPPAAAIEPPPPLPPPAPPPLPPPTPEAAPVEAPPPLPPRKPLPRRQRPTPHHAERSERPPTAALPPALPAPPRAGLPQSAAARLPSVPPPNAISPGYQTLIGAWLERHKRYPESARERGEEGQAVLQFVVDRSGRVVDFAIVESSGHADLDAAVARMMQGAVLPAFPPDMPQSSIRVRVPIRFSLTQ